MEKRKVSVQLPRPPLCALEEAHGASDENGPPLVWQGDRRLFSVPLGEAAVRRVGCGTGV
jgi:hypothetical protein